MLYLILHCHGQHNISISSFTTVKQGHIQPRHDSDTRKLGESPDSDTSSTSKSWSRSVYTDPSR